MLFGVIALLGFMLGVMAGWFQLHEDAAVSPRWNWLPFGLGHQLAHQAIGLGGAGGDYAVFQVIGLVCQAYQSAEKDKENAAFKAEIAELRSTTNNVQKLAAVHADKMEQADKLIRKATDLLNASSEKLEEQSIDLRRSSVVLQLVHNQKHDDYLRRLKAETDRAMSAQALDAAVFNSQTIDQALEAHFFLAVLEKQSPKGIAESVQRVVKPALSQCERNFVTATELQKLLDLKDETHLERMKLAVEGVHSGGSCVRPQQT